MYADGIVHAIDESSILVLILSQQAVASAHVGREIERAISKRHPVVALRIDAAPLTAAFEYFLNQSQWIEGGGSDAAIEQLVGAVGQHLAPGTAISPAHTNQPLAGHRRVVMPRRVWVVAAGAANRSQVQSALDHVSACPNISLVFNKAPKWHKNTGDSYYYYYGGNGVAGNGAAVNGANDANGGNGANSN